jgi:hypothetical protein
MQEPCKQASLTKPKLGATNKRQPLDPKDHVRAKWKAKFKLGLMSDQQARVSLRQR